MCVSHRNHFHFNRFNSTRLQVDNFHRLVNWRCRFCNSRQDLVPNHPCAEPRLDKQDLLVILRWNANSMLCEVTVPNTVLALLQVDVACIREAKLMPKDKTREIPQYGALRCNRPIHGETRGGGLVIIYVRATLAFSAIYPVVGTSNVLEKLAVVIPLPGQIKSLLTTGIYPRRPQIFYKRLGSQIRNFKQNSISLKSSVLIRIPNDPLWDPIARPTERGDFL